jgi:hypothetical protein
VTAIAVHRNLAHRGFELLADLDMANLDLADGGRGRAGCCFGGGDAHFLDALSAGDLGVLSIAASAHVGAAGQRAYRQYDAEERPGVHDSPDV